MKIIFLPAALLISFAAMADVSNDLQIDNAFARPASKQQRNSAVFMQISNQGSDASVVAASSDAARIVELHTHVNDAGVMRMRRIDKIDLPAGETVTLKPGGLHIMFIGLNRDLNLDDSVEVVLELSDGSKKAVLAPIHRAMMKTMNHK